MSPRITYDKEAFNYRKIWYFTGHYTQFQQQYPRNTLLFQVGSYYFAFGQDAQRIIANNQAESGDFDIPQPPVSEPLIIERNELYRHIGIMSETEFPIKIFYDAASPC
jgi:hypothetical protein